MGTARKYNRQLLAEQFDNHRGKVKGLADMYNVCESSMRQALVSAGIIVRETNKYKTGKQKYRCTCGQTINCSSCLSCDIAKREYSLRPINKNKEIDTETFDKTMHTVAN